MPTYIALLRGINVVGKNLISMERLRSLVGEMGFSGVRTYLQSGNVIFEAARKPAAKLAAEIEARLLAKLGMKVSVILRTPQEMREVVAANPLVKKAGVDPAKLHVTFLSDAAPRAARAALEPLAADSERFEVCRRVIYLYMPDGYGVTKLSNNTIEKKLSLRATTRNWRTVNAVLEMAQSPAGSARNS